MSNIELQVERTIAGTVAENAVDIALLVGPITGPHYDHLTDLAASNSDASIQVTRFTL